MTTYINSYLINLALIISAFLTLYFISLKDKTANQYFFLQREAFVDQTKFYLTKKQQIWIGFMLGFLCFLISINQISTPNIYPVDVRYLPIYFAVYYCSNITGVITAGTLIALKIIQHFTAGYAPLDIVNNFILTSLLLVVSIVVVKRNYSKVKSTLTFLFYLMTFRLIILFVAYSPLETEGALANTMLYIFTFASIFLITAYIINLGISVSKSVYFFQNTAVYDSLTKVYNRDSFYFFLDHAYSDAIINKGTFSLAIIDIDNFKQINDTYGHNVGDDVLKHVARIFTEPVQGAIFNICRIGGDEFALVLTGEPKANFDSLQKKLSIVNNSPFETAARSIDINLSIGLTHFHSVSARTDNEIAEKIFENADKALYHAKKNGKNRIYETFQTI
ncbi:GGDEF domain-containing protein [Vagococcus acidifermentans]|uniref:GGDEF domain-containing protein n=1 Tax=Vagococcus acidifermentans TaxID=564710 RepID=A0A430AVQ6_9ENTE|nr:GGDEF domain-containing protein [Vagococcus acidifermentans]RSU12135.1 hypothetical protein CBF27_06830 [Vagococcus acidifermentans]